MVADKPANLGLFPGPVLVEGENWPLQTVLWPPPVLCSMSSATSNRRTKSINEYFEKYYVIDYLILGYTSEDIEPNKKRRHMFLFCTEALFSVAKIRINLNAHQKWADKENIADMHSKY